MNIIQRPLPPVCYSGRKLKIVDAAVIHYISAINVNQIRPFDADVVYDLFVDLNHPGDERGAVMYYEPGVKRSYASCHYFIARDGEKYQFLDESLEAYHAGVSEWQGRHQLNEWSIGIELAGMDPRQVKRRGLPDEWAFYTDSQYAALTELCADLMIRHNIPIEMLLGHDQVAPKRKIDPGPNFDWERLREPLRGIVIT